MNAPANVQRRRACPGLSAPMETGDGLLVRFLPAGTISFDAFAALCAAARRYGNGVIEVTSRGSIQVRGLAAATAPLFADAVAVLDIAGTDGVPIHGSPLAGLDANELIDACALTGDLRQILARRHIVGALSPKISVIIGGGGRLDPASLAADVRLTAQETDGDAALRISVGGDAAGAVLLGVVRLADGVEAAARLLDVIARYGNEARARYVVTKDGIGLFQAAIGDLLTDTCIRESRVGMKPRQAVSPVGPHHLNDETIAYGIGLAFGHATADLLERLIDVAVRAGAAGFRAAPGRVLLAIGMAPEKASAFAAGAGQLGFIVAANDPRQHVIACAGAPICGSAHIASRTLAPDIAASAAVWLDDARTIHISGCAKGCARAASAALTIVGHSEGCSLIANGNARDAAFANVAAPDLLAAIARFVGHNKPGRAHG